HEAVLLHRPDGEHAHVHLALALGPHAPAIEEAVEVVAHRDVDDQREGAKAERSRRLLLEGEDREQHEDDRGEHGPVDRRAPRRRPAEPVRAPLGRTLPAGLAAPATALLLGTGRLAPGAAARLDVARRVAAVLGSPLALGLGHEGTRRVVRRWTP